MKSDASSDGRVVRAGGEGLSLLAAPLNCQILKALEQGPRVLLDLRRAVDSPPQSTMRLYSRILIEQGVVDRKRRAEFPGSTEYRITPAGHELLGVAGVLQRWLRHAPDGPIPLGTSASKSTTKALAEGWSTGLIRALAARPLALTELSRLISTISYPSIERRLSSMRLTGLVERCRGTGRSTPYVVTEWLRRAVVPLTAAAAWERRHRAMDAPPIRQLDVQAAFMLALPLVALPADFEGRIRLAVEVRGGSVPLLGGVLATFRDGGLVSCSPRLDGDVEARVSGPPGAWFERMSGSRGSTLAIGGDVSMAETVLDELRAITAAPAGSGGE